MTPRDAALAGLGILSLALLATIAAELLRTPEPTATIAAAAPASVLPAAAADDSPTLLPVILARPLFAIDRRPKADATVAGAVSDDMPRLSGILVDPAPHAIFQPTGDGKPMVVGVGDQVAGWEVQQIAADSVTLTGPKGTQTLQPKPDPALATAQAAPNGNLDAQGGAPRPPPNAPRQFLPGGMQLPPGVPNPFTGQQAPTPARPNVPQPPTRQPGGAPAAPNRR
jgi:hypothetical protein